MAVSGTTAGIIRELKTDYHVNPIGLDSEMPGFSWKYVSSVTDQMQTAYRIRVALSQETLSRNELIWDSGKVQSGENHGIRYGGEPLEAATRYYWDVELWESSGSVLQSEYPAFFETGLLGSGWSNAAFISPQTKAVENIDPDYIAYTISYDILLKDSVAGFVFGADTDQYGSFYLWEIGNSGDRTAFLRFSRVSGNQFEVLQTVSLESLFPVREEMNDRLIPIRIEVTGNNTITYIQDTVVARQEIEACYPGRIGYLQKRGRALAYLDNIRVVDSNGKVITEEGFSEARTIFSPYYHRTTNGMLEMRNGTFLSWQEETAAPMFRRAFVIPDKEIDSARLYATALGVYDFRINGQVITKDLFNPGKLAYNDRLYYRTHDVTELIVAGDNVMGATLGHGWYDRGVGYPGNWTPWGDRTALLAKLVIRYTDGTEEIFVTDGSWQVYENGPIRRDDLYQGEYYDANYEQAGWSEPGFDTESKWTVPAVNEVREEYQTVPREGRPDSPIINYDRLEPVSCMQIGENTYVYDFGRNFSGVCRIRVKGQQGAVIRMRHGEVLNQENMRNRDDVAGSIWTANLLTAEATDYYVLKGEGTEEYSPAFTCHGFRYLQVDIVGNKATIEKVEGIALASPVERTGHFRSSSQQLNRLYETTVNGMWSNFLDNPTDCPQRDERHGWTGDALAFAGTAVYHGDVFLFYNKFLRDMRGIQNEDGTYPNMAPWSSGAGWDGSGGSAGSSGWSDAGIGITWQLYLQYGDKRIIEDNFSAMCAWVDRLEETSEQYIRNADGHGDHLSLEDTPHDMSDTAWCAYSAKLLAKMAAVIGKDRDAERYDEMAGRFQTAWQERYLTNGFRLFGDSQTAYLLGLEFGLFRNEEEREQAAAFLNNKIVAGGYHPTTGFIGDGLLLPVLSEYGYHETAYQLLMQEEYPSWQYTVMKGATTPVEWWNAYEEHEDGTYSWNSSLNHLARGSYGSWFYTGILGIKADENEPGYRRIILQPLIGGDLTFAEGSYESIQGTIQSSWEVTETGYRYEAVIPAGSTAELHLPAVNGKDATVHELTSGYHRYEVSADSGLLFTAKL